MFVAKLQYVVTTGLQGESWDAGQLKNGTGFEAKKGKTVTLDRTEGSMVTYDLIGRIAGGRQAHPPQRGKDSGRYPS